MIRIRLSIALPLITVLGLLGQMCQAGNFLLDFSILEGEAEGWDIIDPIMADEECSFLGDAATPCTIFPLTDRSGEQDDDVVLEILEIAMAANNPDHLGEDQVYDGVDVPVAAIGDYHYRNPDTAGGTVPMRFRNLNPGVYNVTAFEGRTTDGNGQFAKVWVGDADGSNEPGVPGEHEGRNTGDFAAGAFTQEDVTIGEGDFLWYRHLEDNSGGISGIIVRQLRGSDVTPGDFNADGMVDAADFSILANHFNQDGKFVDGDMTFNGHIDLEDFIEFRGVYDAQVQGAAAIPEPTSHTLTMLVVVSVVGFWRRRFARTQ